MRTVNTDRLNQFWNEGILQKVKELTERITRVSEKIDVLDTKEEIEANTDDEKMAGALAVKEMFGQLDSKLSDITNPQNVNFSWNSSVYDTSGYCTIKRLGKIIIGTISTKNLVDIPSNQMIHIIAGMPKTLFPVFAVVKYSSKSYVAYIDNATDYGDFCAVYFPYYNDIAIPADTNIAMSFVYISQ